MATFLADLRAKGFFKMAVIFLILQFLDILTTSVVIYGFPGRGYEKNPLINLFIQLTSSVLGGLVLSKITVTSIAVVVMLSGRYKFLRLVNVIFILIFFWNCYMIYRGVWA